MDSRRLPPRPGARATSDQANGDESLMLRVREGHAEALQLLLDRHWNRLVTYAAGILGGRDDAEDVVQETFVRVWRQRAQWRPFGSMAGYLYRITRNLALNARRERRSRELREARSTRERFHSAPRTPEQDFDDAWLRRELEAALASLPDRRREIFVLSRFHGLSHVEIAETLGISPNTVSNQMTTAMADLRVRFAQQLRAE